MIKQAVLALYLRISDEDEEAVNESGSITGQRLLLENFVSGKEEFFGCKVLEFIDDGYSGTNFNRPGISMLLEQVFARGINCIIVKDFSRFGRNYLEVGNFIEQIFPSFGVRFISVNDNFDSNFNNGLGDAIDTAFKNLIYDLYSRDISQKIRSVRRTKAEAGKFVTAFAPYGYVKSKVDKNTLIIDQECAEIVRRIYQMVLDGVPKGVIARQLNAENIPSPIMVRKQRKDNFRSWCANEKCYWTTATIAHILEDRRYTGDLVYGKVRPLAVGSRKYVSVPESQWIITPNAHPAIVTKEVFNAVGEMKRNHNYKRNAGMPFSGKIKCSVCNHTFTRKDRGSESHYYCRTHLQTDEYECFSGKLKEMTVEAAILSSINTFLGLYEKEEATEVRNTCHKGSLLRSLAFIKRKIVLYRKERLINYESYKAEKISKDSFLAKLNEQDNNLRVAEEESLRLEAELNQIKDNPDISEIKNPKGVAAFEVLTKEMVDVFVKKIFVDVNGKIQVMWTFSAPFYYGGD